MGSTALNFALIVRGREANLRIDRITLEGVERVEQAEVARPAEILRHQV